MNSKRKLFNDIWQESELAKRLIILSTLKNQGPSTAYGVSKNILGKTKAAGYASVLHSYLESLEKRNLVTSEIKKYNRREKKIYSISIQGERFFEDKKTELSEL